jgi:hypothetical protein
MVKSGVLFEVRPEFLNIIYTRFGFKGLKCGQFVRIFCTHTVSSYPAELRNSVSNTEIEQVKIWGRLWKTINRKYKHAV